MQEKNERIKNYTYNAIVSVITALIVSSVIASVNKVAGSASQKDLKEVSQDSKIYTDAQVKMLSERMFRYESVLTNMATKDDIKTLKEMMNQQSESMKMSVDLLKELSKNRR